MPFSKWRRASFCYGCVKAYLFAHYVDLRCRHETPAGIAGLGRPHRREAPRRLPDRPRGAACLELQSTGKFNTVFVKNEFFNQIVIFFSI
jgi:hypothetical protein